MGIKVAVIIPDRGDRPTFLSQCQRLLKAQTHQPDFVYLIDENIIPSTEEVDITKRYRLGYEKVSDNNIHFGKVVDVIAFWENDDYYSPFYLERMLDMWDRAGRPDLFGTNYTVYYHLILKKYFTMRHAQRSSAMNMLIKPDLKIHWPKNQDPFTDQHLWLVEQAGIKSRALCEPSPMISFGVKHGIGKTGGKSHRDKLYRFINDDKSFTWLENLIEDEEVLSFYKNYSEQLQKEWQ